MAHGAPDLAHRPGLGRRRRLKLSRWLISPFESPVHGVNIVFLGFIFFFFPRLPAINDAPTLGSGGSPAGLKHEAHPGFDPAGSNSAGTGTHDVLPTSTHNKTEKSRHLFYAL